jgi:hypothetical protein
MREMEKKYVVYTKVLDWQLASIERDYIKDIVAIYDTEEEAQEACEVLNTDNYEEEFLYREFEVNENPELTAKLRKLGRL